VKKVSEFNETMYRSFVSPWVNALANPFAAERLKWLHPTRSSHYLLSETFNPSMHGIATLAGPLAASRSREQLLIAVRVHHVRVTQANQPPEKPVRFKAPSPAIDMRQIAGLPRH